MTEPLTGPILALDSATAAGSAAVGDATGVRAEAVLSVAAGHSSALLPAIDQMLAAAGIRPGDLAAVVVGAGPGSFTGIRIAAATARGIVQGLGVPLYAYSSLLATALAGWGADRPVCALFDARRRDVYAAYYRFEGTGDREQGTGPTIDNRQPAVIQTLMEPTALSLDELLERYRGGEPPLFVGDAAVLHAAELERELGARVLPAHLGAPRAASLVWLAAHVPELGRLDDPAAWEPDYVRASGAERIAARGGAG